MLWKLVLHYENYFFSAFFFIPSFVFAKIEIKSSKINQAYLKQIINKALDKKLYQERTWHLLVHYKSNIFSTTSEAKGPYFFASKNGRSSPKDELIKTLEIFFLGDKRIKELDHPICRYPARFKWLNKRLKFDSQKLPSPSCSRFKRWKKALWPKSVSIIFADSYLGNPASIFGHTLIKFDKLEKVKGQSLLDYGINYGANTEGANSLEYFYKGIFGGFGGTFVIFPYYLKVNEYANLESRDLWEFELNFNADEIDMLIAHLWEMGFASFDYYFFDKNCSYQLLTVLEVARPSLRVSDEFFFVVTPIDTVKILQNKYKMIKKVKYRPSILSRYKQKYELLTSKEKKIFLESLNNHSIPDSNIITEKVFVIETLLDYLAFKKRKIKKLEKEEISFRRNLLIERSKLKAFLPEKFEKPNNVSNPILSHESSNFAFSFGRNLFGDYLLLKYTPSYRGYRDSPLGNSIHSQLLFFSTELQYFPKEDKVFIKKFDLFDIGNLSPFDYNLFSASWLVKLGMEQLDFVIQEEPDPKKIKWLLNTGFGPSFGFHKSGIFNKLLIYFFLRADLEYSNFFEDKYRFKPGLMGGFFWWFNYHLGLQLNAIYLSIINEDFKRDIYSEANLTLAINENSAFHITYIYNFEYKIYDLSGSLKIYF